MARAREFFLFVPFARVPRVPAQQPRVEHEVEAVDFDVGGVGMRRTIEGATLTTVPSAMS